MKKLLVLFMCLSMAGCSGSTIQTNQQADQVVDIAFVALLISQPELKPEIVMQLKNINSVLEADISYQMLVSEISNRFAGKYTPLIPIILQFIGTDAPVSEDWLTMFDGTKEAIKLKIDHLLILAGG